MINNKAQQADKHRRRKHKNRPQKNAKFIKRSDYSGANLAGRALFAPGKPEKILGGTKSELTSTSQFSTNVFYIPERSSSGEFEVSSGSMSLTCVKGELNIIYQAKEDKGETASHVRLTANKSTAFKKGDNVRFYNTAGIVECFMVTSSKFAFKQLSPAVSSDTAISQYRNTRTEILGNVQPIKKRTDSAEKRARLAAQIEASRGKKSKKTVSQNFKDGGNNGQPAMIIGANPQPIGDIG